MTSDPLGPLFLRHPIGKAAGCRLISSTQTGRHLDIAGRLEKSFDVHAASGSGSFVFLSRRFADDIFGVGPGNFFDDVFAFLFRLLRLSLLLSSFWGFLPPRTPLCGFSSS